MDHHGILDDIIVITDVTSTANTHTDEIYEADTISMPTAKEVSHKQLPIASDDDPLDDYPQKEILLNSNITLPKNLMSYTVNKELTGLEAIRALPHHISGCVNSGNLKELKELVNTHFDENCTFRSRVIEENLVGRDYVFLLYEALLQALPDFIFVAKKTSFVKNIAVNPVYFTGTRAFQAKNQYLFQRINCSMADVVAKHNHLASEERFQMKSLESALKAAGKKISVWGGGFMRLTFDIETFKVTHFEADWGLRAFKESPYESY
jgi:hypothetical protein